jgi:dGTPase
MKKAFEGYAMTPENPAWEAMTRREDSLYERVDDVRSPFFRDYTRLLHSHGFRRMKHKTQVFFNIDNDHICTRMEHVAHVESVSGTIANALGLNQELTKAISIGHDIGHAPFGHQGEKILSKLCKNHLGEPFWHERNGLHFVDDVELLADNYNRRKNLDLTYAVRDGIISHCGEVDQNGLRPRQEIINLEREFTKPGMFQPATWEGCVVKIADKIAYVGRDIEDAISLGFIGDQEKEMLLEMARENDEQVMNTTVIMHNMIIDICKHSSPENGICLSPKYNEQLNEIKRFNYRYIYGNPRFFPYQEYAGLVLNKIFESLYDLYRGADTWKAIDAERRWRPALMDAFSNYLAEYCEESIVPEGELLERAKGCVNHKIYGDLRDEKQYVRAVIDYISGMTDRFAVRVFNELLKY